MEPYYKNKSCKLYQCDNLELLKSIKDNYIDLIYCDILYNTGRKFKDYSDDLGTPKQAIQWYEPRLLEMKRVLKETGAIYIHCDSHLSHYMKIEMDNIFGIENFRNEIIWCYKTSLRNSKLSFGKDHDVIFFYAKSSNHLIHPDRNDFPASQSTVDRWSKYADETGFVDNKYFAASSNNSIPNKMKEGGGFNINYGIPRDWWEISNVARGNNPEISKKYGKYDTQKPKKLLSRIIKSSSNPGDIVADFFMGCGIAGEVSAELNRRFIGCDIGDKACEMAKERLEKFVIP